jgi:predicted ester cyclase
LTFSFIEHAEAEQRRDFDAAMDTFGTPNPRYELPGGEIVDGHDAVMEMYRDLFGAFPDFEPVVDRSDLAHCGDSVIFTAQMTATHTGSLRGLPATGRRIDVPIVAIFDFDGTDLLGARVLFDRLTMFIQLGVARNPETTSGKVLTMLNHPLHLTRALLRRSRG